MDTREKIAEAAERLFAERNFQQVSVRDIVREAGVNLGAVNYHFGSKEELIFSIISNRISVVNEDRLLQLSQLEERQDYSVHEVVRAFVAPAFALSMRDAEKRHFSRLLGQINTGLDPALKQRVLNEFDPVLQRFLFALRQLLPELKEQRLKRYLYFSIGAMAHTLLNETFPQTFSGAGETGGVAADVCEDLIAFITAGLSHG